MKSIIKDIKEFTCIRCGNVWIGLKLHPVKCPNPKCQAQLKKFKPKLQITRIETTKKILTISK